ncbi:hypothetical protein WA158_003003 [Blastocystis sp. Blastoise]
MKRIQNQISINQFDSNTKNNKIKKNSNRFKNDILETQQLSIDSTYEKTRQSSTPKKINTILIDDSSSCSSFPPSPLSKDPNPLYMNSDLYYSPSISSPSIHSIQFNLSSPSISSPSPHISIFNNNHNNNNSSINKFNSSSSSISSPSPPISIFNNNHNNNNSSINQFHTSPSPPISIFNNNHNNNSSINNFHSSPSPPISIFNNNHNNNSCINKFNSSPSSISSLSPPISIFNNNHNNNNSSINQFHTSPSPPISIFNNNHNHNSSINKSHSFPSPPISTFNNNHNNNSSINNFHSSPSPPISISNNSIKSTISNNNLNNQCNPNSINKQLPACHEFPIEASFLSPILHKNIIIKKKSIDNKEYDSIKINNNQTYKFNSNKNNDEIQDNVIDIDSPNDNGKIISNKNKIDYIPLAIKNNEEEDDEEILISSEELKTFLYTLSNIQNIIKNNNEIDEEDFMNNLCNLILNSDTNYTKHIITNPLLVKDLDLQTYIYLQLGYLPVKLNERINLGEKSLEINKNLLGCFLPERLSDDDISRLYNIIKYWKYQRKCSRKRILLMDTNTKIFIKYALPLIKSVITGDFYENGVEDKIPDISIYSLSEKQIFYEIMLSICDIINFAFVLYQEELDHYGLNILLFPDFIYKYVTLNILPRSNCPKTLHNRIQEIRSIITYIERKNVYIDNKMKDIIKETLTYITHKSSVMITDNNFISKNDSKAFEDLNKKKKMEALISLQDYYNIIRTLFEKINIYIEEINNKKNINDIYIKKFHIITILMMYLLQTCTGCPLRNNDIYNLKLFENLKKYRNENTKKEYIYIIHTGSKNGNIPYSDGKKFPDIYILCEKFQKIYDKYIIIRNQICEYLKDNDIEYTTNLFLYIRKPNTNSNYVASQFTYSTYPTICKHQLKKLFSNIPKDHSGYSYRHCFATWFGRTNCVNPLYCQSFIRSCHHTNDVHDKYYNLNIKYKTIYNNNDFKLNDLCTSELGIKVFIDYVLDKQFAKEMNYFVPERDIDGNLITIHEALTCSYELLVRKCTFNYDINRYIESKEDISSKMESKDSAKINNCNNENKYIKLSDQQISPIIISPIIKFNSINNNEDKNSIELISPLLLPSLNSNNNNNNYNLNDNNISNYCYSPIPSIHNSVEDFDRFNISIISDSDNSINNNSSNSIINNIFNPLINNNNSSSQFINHNSSSNSLINNNNSSNPSINNNNSSNLLINNNNQNNNNSSNLLINHNNLSNSLINNNNQNNNNSSNLLINHNNLSNSLINNNNQNNNNSSNLLINNNNQNNNNSSNLLINHNNLSNSLINNNNQNNNNSSSQFINHNSSSNSLINNNNSSNPSINHNNLSNLLINNNSSSNSLVNNNNSSNSLINNNNQKNNNFSNPLINNNNSSNQLINHKKSFNSINNSNSSNSINNNNPSNQYIDNNSFSSSIVNNSSYNPSINNNNLLNPLTNNNNSSSPNIFLNNINSNLINPIISNNNDISFQKKQNINNSSFRPYNVIDNNSKVLNINNDSYKVTQYNNQSSSNLISTNNSNKQPSIQYNIDLINADNIIPNDFNNYSSLSKNNDISYEINNQSSSLSILNYSNDNYNLSSCYNNSQNSQYENDPIQINNKQTYNLINNEIIVNEKQYYTFLHEGSFPSELFDLYLYLNVYNQIVTANNINLFIHNYYNYNDFINDSYLYNISYEIQFHFNSNSPIFFIFTIYLKNKDRYYLIINKLTNGDKKKTLTINIYNFFDIEDGNDKYLNQIINQIKKLFKTNTSKIIVQYKKCDKSYDNNNAILIFGMIKQFIKEYNMFQKNIKHIRNLNFDYDNIDLDSEQLNVNKFFLYHLNKEK